MFEWVVEAWRHGKVPTQGVEFDVPDGLVPPPEPGKSHVFRDPAGIGVLEKLVAGLNEAGYRATAPHPGKGVEACSRWLPNESWEIDLLLGVEERTAGFVRCYLETRCWPRKRNAFRSLRGPAPDQECIERWRQFCGVIEAQLAADYGITDLSWTDC